VLPLLAQTVKGGTISGVKRTLALIASLTVFSILLAASPASAIAPRWVYVGKENFAVNGEDSITVPTYVNTNSIVGDRYDTFTITFQARYGGRQGINRVNVGVIVDCNDASAYADQFIVYYGKGSSDYDQVDGGDISPRIQARAVSYCR
jgi:hypothetical protein